MNGTPFGVEKISPRAGLELGTARSVGAPNCKTYTFQTSVIVI